MKISIFEALARFFHDIFRNVYAVLAGGFASILGYFIPIKGIVNLLILFFILDVIFGYWAARRLRGEKFSVKLIWGHTIPRMLISIVLVMSAFMWDVVYDNDLLSTYKIIGWFISGVLLFSIAENGYKITKWAIFSKLGDLFARRTEELTGMDVSEEPEKEEPK